MFSFILIPGVHWWARDMLHMQHYPAQSRIAAASTNEQASLTQNSGWEMWLPQRRPPSCLVLGEERGRTADAVPVTSVLGRKNYITPKPSVFATEQSLTHNPNPAQSRWLLIEYEIKGCSHHSLPPPLIQTCVFCYWRGQEPQRFVLHSCSCLLFAKETSCSLSLRTSRKADYAFCNTATLEQLQ